MITYIYLVSIEIINKYRMKIKELRISRDVKELESPRKILSTHGWHVLGAGVEGAVAEHPNKSYVLKLFNSSSKYVEFVNFVKSHQDNPHLPKFGRYVRPVPGSDYSYVRMEKLSSVEEYELIENYLPEMAQLYIKFDEFGRGYGANNLFIRVKNNLKYYWQDFRPESKEDLQTMWDKLGRKPDSSWEAICEELTQFKSKSSVELDLHNDNFMLRKKVLVITDPFI